MKREKFKFDICDEFDCTAEYCLRNLGFECNGEFWKECCIFYGEHIELNTEKYYNE